MLQYTRSTSTLPTVGAGADIFSSSTIITLNGSSTASAGHYITSNL